LKIIFNHTLKDWYWQIFDEWNRNHEIIISDIYKDKEGDKKTDYLYELEEAIFNNPGCDFIFDFDLDITQLIRWQNRRINVPIVIFAVNAIMRPYVAKMSIFSNIWYVEQYAKPLMEKFNKRNLFFDGMAANPFIFYPKELNKINDIGFIGRQYGERGYWLNSVKNYAKKKNLKCNFPLAHGEKMFLSQSKINDLYNQTKINISFAPKEPPGRIVNLRTFEICMSGNFQLMQYTPCIEEFFEPGSEIICWKTKKDLFDKIEYYLENEKERAKIAKNGYKRAIENHTWSKRADNIITFLNNKKELKIKNYLIHIKYLLKEEEFQKVKQQKEHNLNNLDFKLIWMVFKKEGYKKRDIQTIKSKLKIKARDRSFYYKLNLKNYRLIQFFGKILMVIKVLPRGINIKLKNWEDLEKVLFLIENKDLSIPQFGVLTNGLNWIIKDFETNKWLRRIPQRGILKRRGRFKTYFLIRITIFLKNYYQSIKFVKRILPMSLKEKFKNLFDLIEFNLRKLLKTPQMYRFS